MVLAPLVLLAVLFFALALAFVLEDMIKNIANVVRGIKIVGGYLAGALDSIARAISGAMGAVEHGIDSIIGAAWHLFATYLDKTWHQLEAHAALLAHLAELVGNGIYSVSGLRGLVHGVIRTVHGIEAGIKTLEREWHGIEHRVKALETQIGKGIGNDVRSQVKALEREVTGIEKGVVPSLRNGIKTAEGEVTQLENFIKAIPGTNYLDWAAGLVAAGLGTALWNLFKCPTFLNKTLGRGCGLWNGLEDLFGAFIDLAVFTDVCAVLTLLEDAAGVVLPPLVALLTDINLGPCEVPPTSWAALNVANGPTPPPQSLPTSSIP